MKTCIFSPICQFAQPENDNTLFEEEFNVTENDRINYRKLFSKTNKNSFVCGEACPMWNLSESLLRKNNLLNKNISAFARRSRMAECRKVLEQAVNNPGYALMCIGSNGVNLNELSDLLTYCGICSLWRSAVRRVPIYNLNFSSYLDADRGSWNINPDSIDNDLLFKRNMINGKSDGGVESNILIISGIDYVNFKDYESSLLLKIIGTRNSTQFPTLIVGPEPSTLLGTGQLFSRLTGVLQEHKVTIKW